jgi:hypothetical protein
MSYIFFKLIDIIVGLRISEEEELIGADIIYHIIENNEIETEINKDDIIYDTEYIPEINEFKIKENEFKIEENEKKEECDNCIKEVIINPENTEIKHPFGVQ